MILIALLGVYWGKKDDLVDKTLFLKAVVYSAILPYIAVSTGWILAETGRWPWIVYGLQKVEDAISPNVPAWNVAISLTLMLVIYTVFTIVAYKLAIKYGTGEINDAIH